MKGKRSEHPKLQLLKGKKPTKREIKPRPIIAIGRCPKWIGTPYGKAFWYEMGKALCKHGVLTVDDKHTFAILAQAYHLMVVTQEQLNREDLVIADARKSYKKNPLASIYKTASEQFTKLSERFGLDPLSRSRMGLDFHVLTPEEREMEALLD